MKIKYSRLVAGLAVATTVALLGKGAVATAANSTNDNTRTVQRGGANVKKSAAVKKTSAAKKVQKSTAESKTSAKTPAKNTAKKVATKAPVSSSSSSKSKVASSSAKSSVKSPVVRTSSTSSSRAAASSKVATRTARTSTSSSTRRVATRTTTKPAAKPAARRNTISFAGVTMSVITGNMSVTTAPSGNVAQTWGGQTHLSVTDGQSTHIIGHNTSSFGRIMALGAGSAVTVTDGNGNTRTYHVYSIKNVTDQGYIQGTKTSVYSKIVSANQGEQVVLQTCISSTVNRLVWAR